jgi:hypothetical protein
MMLEQQQYRLPDIKLVIASRSDVYCTAALSLHTQACTGSYPPHSECARVIAECKRSSKDSYKVLAVQHKRNCTNSTHS